MTGWSTYCSPASWRILSGSSSPSYQQRLGSVTLAETDLLNLTESDSTLFPLASRQFWTSSDLLPPDPGPALSRPAGWRCYSGGSVSHSQGQNSVRHHGIWFRIGEAFVYHLVCVCVLPCRYYLKCYVFVSQLEALNIPYTVQSFLSSPKEGLIKGLWKNHSHEPQVSRDMRSRLELQATAPPWWQPLCPTGSAVGGRPLLRISGVWPSAVEQSTAKAAKLQLGEQKRASKNLQINYVWHMFCSPQVGHLQRVLEAVVAVPALWEVTLHFIGFSIRHENKYPSWFVGWHFAQASQTVYHLLFSPGF